MIIGLDIDDTITRHPEFFSFLSQALVEAGHRVIIITFRESREETAAELAAWGIAYNDLVTVDFDACVKHGAEEWKGVVCREHGVEILFEDDPDVLRHVDDSVLCMMPVDNDSDDPDE